MAGCMLPLLRGGRHRSSAADAIARAGTNAAARASEGAAAPMSLDAGASATRVAVPCRAGRQRPPARPLPETEDLAGADGHGRARRSETEGLRCREECRALPALLIAAWARAPQSPESEMGSPAGRRSVASAVGRLHCKRSRGYRQPLRTQPRDLRGGQK